METRYFDDRSSSEALNEVDLQRSASQTQRQAQRPPRRDETDSSESEQDAAMEAYGDISEIAAPKPAHHEHVNGQDTIEKELSGTSQNGPGGLDMFDDADDEREERYLTEVAGPAPAERGEHKKGEEEALRQSGSRRRRIVGDEQDEGRRIDDEEARPAEGNGQVGTTASSDSKPRVSHIATQVYVISHLIIWSIFGCLARLGLQALTFYPGAPEATGILWANVGGSLIMGFLSEDRRIFREEWGIKANKGDMSPVGNGGDKEKTASEEDLIAMKKEHTKVKKTIPLYIGLTTGFCGSFTSFSSFIRDSFLAMSNSLTVPVSQVGAVSASSIVSRSGGRDFMAFLAVLIMHICLSLMALSFGAHIAIFLDPITPTLPFRLMRKVLDRLIVFLAIGCWIGAVVMAIVPPHDVWRSRAVFAIVFAPLGTITRFYLSLYLNVRLPSFPLGTFAANILGTLVLGMCYDLQHAGPGAKVVSCAVLQGVEDGFCGCLTTVSTWVAELKGLRRAHAYRYGAGSVLVAWLSLVVIMGSLRWTKGFSSPAC